MESINGIPTAGACINYNINITRDLLVRAHPLGNPKKGKPLYSRQAWHAPKLRGR